MVGLAEVEHDVVGHVDDGVDRAHPGQRQPAGHPGRGRAVGHPLENGGGEARAEIAGTLR